MTQKQRVLEHLKDGNTITSYEAMVNMGISDLPVSFYIYKLEQEKQDELI